jgi:hypothetical protein
MNHSETTNKIETRQLTTPLAGAVRVKFSEVPIGALFEFRGLRYEKLAVSMAGDERGWGNVFHDYAEVTMERNQAGTLPRSAPVASIRKKAVPGNRIMHSCILPSQSAHL